MRTIDYEAQRQKYREEEAEREARDKAVLEAFAPTIPVPEGFEASWEEQDGARYEKVAVLVLSNPTTEVKFTFRPWGDGTTSFNTPRGWATFDRVGVEPSFYWRDWAIGGAGEKSLTPEKMAEVFAEQLKRIAEARKYYETAISVPQIGFTTSPERLARDKATLAKGGALTFTPSGFGTGYTVARRPSRFATRAKPELEAFFGFSPLYVSTFDAD